MQYSNLRGPGNNRLTLEHTITYQNAIDLGAAASAAGNHDAMTAWLEIAERLAESLDIPIVYDLSDMGDDIRFEPGQGYL